MSPHKSFENIEDFIQGKINLTELVSMYLNAAACIVVAFLYLGVVYYLLDRKVPMPYQLAQKPQFQNLTPEQKKMIIDVSEHNPAIIVGICSFAIVGFIWILYMAEDVMAELKSTVGWETYLTIGLVEFILISINVFVIWRFRHQQKQILAMFETPSKREPRTKL